MHASLSGNLILAFALLLTPMTPGTHRVQVILLMRVVRDTSRVSQLGSAPLEVNRIDSEGIDHMSKGFCEVFLHLKSWKSF